MKIRKKAEKAINKAIDNVFEEIESAPPYDLPALIEAIIELRKLITDRLRIFLYGFGTCFALVVAYLVIRIIV